MKKDVPKDFLSEYEAKRSNLEASLDQITSLLKLRLGQLAARRGIRARITDSRIKRPAKLWKKATKAGLSVPEAFTKVEDVLGIRSVCNNLSDIAPLIEMIRTECSILTVLEIKDMVSSPTRVGYRATHLRTELREPYAPEGIPVPCEIQIRTFAQDAWARLSRADLYGKNVPSSIQRLAQALSTQLSAIDEIGQLIRDELNKNPPTADETRDSDSISPQRLALLYKQKYREEIYEWTLFDWVRNLKEAEVESIGEVRALLDDTRMRNILDKVSNRIRGFPLEEGEWVAYSALVASEITTPIGIRAVRNRIQQESDEITVVARSQVLPRDIDDLIQDLKEGSQPLKECLTALDCFDACAICGAEVFRGTEQVVLAILEYYEKEEDDWGLYDLIETWRIDQGYLDGGNLCDWCDYQWHKTKEE